VVRGDVGTTASISCAGALPYGQPLDQRTDGALSLRYEWPALPDELEILGYPRLELSIASSTPVAFLSAKLCDVWPDGTTSLVSRAVLNLTHRDSHSAPERLKGEHFYEVVVELDATSWVFEAGHRVALHIAGADWPNVWPPPKRGTLSIDLRGARLMLPCIPLNESGSGVPEFKGPRKDPARSPGEGPPPLWRIDHDVLAREKRVLFESRSNRTLEIGGRLLEYIGGTARVSTDDPGRAALEGRSRFDLHWPEANVATESRIVLSSDAETWHLYLELDVFEGNETKWSRQWKKSFPRYLS
jgi:hypothetical protein